LLVGLDGLHVIAVERDGSDRLVVTVESEAEVMGCRSCGVIAHGHGRVDVRLVDAPAFGHPVRIIWRKRRWLCREPVCEVGSFVEQDEAVAAPRAAVDDAGVPVGDRADPPRARLRERGSSSARHRVGHRVGVDQAAAGGRRR
jgi:hypothetical protein